MTAISISVGSALAAIDGSFSWIFYILTILAGIFMHAATNLINDYYDVRSGVDFQGVSTGIYRPHPLLEGKLTPRQVLLEACGLYGLAIIIGLYLAATRGWPLFWMTSAKSSNRRYMRRRGVVSRYGSNKVVPVVRRFSEKTVCYI